MRSKAVKDTQGHQVPVTVPERAPGLEVQGGSARELVEGRSHA
jgi:hypothetical protein